MTADDSQPHVEVGDFCIEKRIGAGGMGIVYQARQRSLNRIVALKVLGSALTRPSDIARFRREAQAAARLHHPGIAAIYFIGQDGELCYLAMEYIDGTTLLHIIDRLSTTHDPEENVDSLARKMPEEELLRPPIRFDQPQETVDEDQESTEIASRSALTPAAQQLVASTSHIKRSCELVRNAALALDYAHKQGVVHRDIKPANLMLDRQGGVHLIDFGLARFFEDNSLTSTGQLVGTPMYMSPEQVTARLALDHRTDIYSLGLVLHELLTLCPPMVARTREELLRQIVTKAFPPLRRQNQAIPQPMENVVHKALAKDPDERYASAAEFAADLQRFLDGQPVSAHPYRYAFDEGEIAALRPAWMLPVAAILIAAAIVMLATGVLGFIGKLVMSLPPGRGSKSEFAFTFADFLLYIGASTFGLGLYITATGVLSGRSWARWLVLGIAILAIIAILTVGGLLLVMWLFSPPVADRWDHVFVGIYVVVFGLMLAGAGAIAYSLLTAKTSAWFRFASSLRAEHAKRRTVR